MSLFIVFWLLFFLVLRAPTALVVRQGHSDRLSISTAERSLTVKPR
jgi:hypothetical protein